MKTTTTICSIHFDDLIAYRPFRPFDGVGANHKFVLPAPDKGKYSTLAVRDMMETQRPMHDMHFETPVFGERIAADLVREWANNTIGEAAGRPGVFVCAGDEPTPAELQAAYASMTTWATYIVNRAQRNWIDNKPDQVGDLERKCAKWLGRLNYEWMKEPKQVELTVCRMCGAEVPATSAVCPNGHIVNTEAYKEYMGEKTRIDRELADLEKAAGKPLEPEAQLAAMTAGAIKPPLKPQARA